MAYKRRTSAAIEQALIRATNLESVDPLMDLGNGLALTTLRSEAQAAQVLLDAYNLKLAEADGALNALKDKEREINELSSRLLASVGVIYGKSSSAYEQAGGTRTSERARRSSSTTTGTPPAPTE